MKHIRTIINKEWAEVFKNRTVLYTTLLLPLIFAILPLIMLKSTAGSLPDMGDAAATGLPEGFLKSCQGMTGSDCLQAYLVSQFMFMFMLMPMIIPINIVGTALSAKRPPAA